MITLHPDAFLTLQLIFLILVTCTLSTFLTKKILGGTALARWLCDNMGTDEGFRILLWIFPWGIAAIPTFVLLNELAGLFFSCTK